MPETPVKIDVKRSDKRFSMTSPEVGTMIARALDNAEVSVELTGYKSTIYVQILNDEILVSFGKVNGLGGLPVGSSGRVLVLLSGGIDSPVAAIRMMKRGCNIDLLHFYQFPNHEEVLKSKIMQIVAVLREYGFSGKLYLAPYSEFYKHTFDSVPQKKELVMFRRFILKVANELAKENKTLGIASGDNLAQVASQTLENLYATNEASKLPVYRPLVSYDKAEIIKLAKEYGTYDASIEEYKDCCSLVAVKHPETKAKLEEIKEIEDKIGVDKIVEETIKKIKIIA
jgi:thiamine biosynthesis protein ThiI